MHRMILAVSCVLLISAAFCENAPANKTVNKITPDQLQRMRSARMRQNGGIIKIPGSGHLSILNAQKKFSESDLASAISQIATFAQDGINVRFVEASFSIATAKAEREKNGAGACVFLIDNESLPMSLIAMEECWGFVNVASLREGNPNEMKLAARFRKEFIRVSSVVFGGVKSQYKTSPLQSVTSLRELDKTPGDEYGMDTLMAMAAHMPEIGIVRGQRITYREACVRGIAPTPTNDIQKAIWNKVHALPKNPMQIEFDPKKGR